MLCSYTVIFLRVCVSHPRIELRGGFFYRWANQFNVTRDSVCNSICLPHEKERENRIIQSDVAGEMQSLLYVYVIEIVCLTMTSEFAGFIG